MAATTVTKICLSVVLISASTNRGVEDSNGQNIDKFNKFQTIYEEITGHNVKWEEVPESLQKVFLNSKQLSVKEYVNFPKDIRIAYLISCKSPDDIILDKIKKQLTSYEKKYGISSEEFYRKYHGSEKLYEGNQEKVCDFLLWHSDYRRYLELNNASR